MTDIASTTRYVYSFEEPADGGRELLGGKGVGLAEMTQLGMPFGACFWKKLPPDSPSRQRFIVNGRSRRCGRIAGATLS